MSIDPGAFRALRELASLSRHVNLDEEGRDQVIRALDKYRHDPQIVPILNSLCVRFGLFQYVSADDAYLSDSERLAHEYHGVWNSVGSGESVFHSEQLQVLHRLLDGESIILSAPTSFGKSTILSAVVASGRWNNIVLIVPTVALIDELRRKVVGMRTDYEVVCHPHQKFGPRNVFILTQERFLEIEDLPKPDFFMIDEFYKLGRGEGEDSRMSLLNVAWDRLRQTGAQYFLAGPNVTGLHTDVGGEVKSSLVVSNFKTVATNVFDRSFIPVDDRQADLQRIWPSLLGPVLVFASSPKKAEDVAVSLSNPANLDSRTEFLRQFVAWMESNYDPRWKFVEALRTGIGIHAGPHPRSLQRAMVRLFESGDIFALVCTSTLIEGVNTSAKTVVVFDSAINRKPIDFFTYSNVRGRAGRMFQHYVGNVVTYMKPPEQVALEIDIPIESQSADLPLSALVQLPRERLSDRSKLRMSSLEAQTYLSMDVIRENRGIDPGRQIAAAEFISRNQSTLAQLNWSGRGTSAQRYLVVKTTLNYLLADSPRSPKVVDRTWKLIQAVEESQGSLQTLVDSQLDYRFANESVSDLISRLLRLQRNTMGFDLPSGITALQRIVNHVNLTQRQTLVANYELFASELSSQFLPTGIHELEEYGLPVELGRKLMRFGMPNGEVLESLAWISANYRSPGVRSTLSTVELWFLDDVASAL